MAQYPFKAEPIEKYEEIPEGSYRCEIIQTDVMTTKDGHGRYISLRFRITEGAYKGRLIFQRITTLNRSDDAMRIGKKHLSLLCYSIGIESFDDTDELLNYETIISIGEKNKLYGFNKIEDGIPGNSNSEEPPIIPPDDFVDDKIPF